MTDDYIIKSYAERMEILSKRSNETLDDAYQKLQTYGKCMIIRPTGFGKTFSLIQIVRHYVEKYPNKRIMYVYPSKIITTEIHNNASDVTNNFYPMGILYGDGNIRNPKGKVDFITMASICDYWGESTQGFIQSKCKLLEEIESGKYSIILFDEMHKCASVNFKKFYEDISDLISSDGLHIAGVTATPNRANEDENTWLHDTMFGGIEVFKYTMMNAIDDGILLPPECKTLLFDTNSFISENKAILQSKYTGRGSKFDEESLNLDIAKLLQFSPDSERMIYEAVSKVGYDLTSSDIEDSYLKFIVFFRDTQDMVDRGPTIEKLFLGALNSVAKKELGFRNDFTYHVDYVISDTADKGNNNIVSQLCTESEHRTCILDATKLGLDENGEVRPKKARHIDLVFNVGVITVGYHVDGVTGVVLMRNASTEITYFQQIGRAFSVKAKRRPIILDMVRNVDKNFVPVRKRLGEIVGALNGEQLTDSDKKKIDKFGDAYLMQTGFEDALQVLMQKFGSNNMDKIIQDEDIILYYTEYSMPLYMIAYNLGVSISQVAKVLVGAGITIDKEFRVERYISLNGDFGNKIFGLLYDEGASNQYKKETGLMHTAVTKVNDILMGGIK